MNASQLEQQVIPKFDFDFNEVEQHLVKAPPTSRFINEAVEKLCQLLYHERLTPDILPYASDTMDGTYSDGKQVDHGIIELVQQQEDGIANMKRQIEEIRDKQVLSLYLLLHVMELERVKFLLKEYLRIRIRKIDQYALHICNNSLEASLSHPERTYLKRYIDLKQQHFMKLCLEKYPKTVRKFGLVERVVDEDGNTQLKKKHEIVVPCPNPRLFVMVRINTPRAITLGTQQLNQGDILFLPYSEVKKINDQTHEYLEIL